ncbi:MAG: phenylacetate--CoA ligase family protein [Phycisphaerales bacterium]|nr:MAG: phenylacetate--CoA ligase family protein [Phycisphaerales bacterium]
MYDRVATAVYNLSPVWVQNILCTLAGRRYLARRYGGEFSRWAAFYARARLWSESRLYDYQREQLAQLIRHCFETVPYYTKVWKQAGLCPDDFRDVPDLAKFPCTTKEDLFAASDSMISTSVAGHKLLKFMTGGSTGMPLPLYHTPAEIQQHFAAFWDRMRPGVKLGDRYATFQGKEVVPSQQKRPPYWRENRAANQRLYSMGHLSPEKLHTYAGSLLNEPFVYYQGYASFLLVVAEFMAENGLTPATPPEAVFTTSEQLTAETRKLFEETWRTKVWDEYCQGEHCALIQECEHGNRHAQMDYGVVEYEPIGFEGDQLLAELICTGLIPRAVPRIRYRVGDRVLIKRGFECPCGRPGPVITAIRGRTSECIITPDGRKYPHISLIVDLLRNVRRTQVVQERPDEIIVRVVPFPQFTATDEEHVARSFAERIGGGIGVTVQCVTDLERLPNGKVLSIISRIPGHLDPNRQSRQVNESPKISVQSASDGSSADGHTAR